VTARAAREMRREVRAYGSSPSQFVRLVVPPGARGTVVLLHGGWWRDRFDLELMAPLGERFQRAGWATANIEYRRTGEDGGGWPVTLQDVDRALDAVADLPRPLVLVGHSAGAHLSLLSDPRRREGVAVVSLAPVTDLLRSAHERLGEDAVREFLSAAPEAGPAASPIRVLTGGPHLIVHGGLDGRVPVGHSLDYAAEALRGGADVELLLLAAADHFVVIDPDQAFWAVVDGWLDRLAP
jgi:acetyl esterase/lipase